MIAVLTLLFLAQAGSSVAQDIYKLEFENEYVRAGRIHYAPNVVSDRLSHPTVPTVYFYITDSGPVRFDHEHVPITRQPVTAGSMRFAGPNVEKHTVNNLTDKPSDYFRLELKTDPVDRMSRDVRLSPAGEFENKQVRIRRFRCEVNDNCNSEALQFPTVLIDGSSVKWANISEPVRPQAGQTLTLVEFKSKPIGVVPPPLTRSN